MNSCDVMLEFFDRIIVRLRGWSEYALLVAGDIEFFADLAETGNLSVQELLWFQYRTTVTLYVLRSLQQGTHHAEVARLRAAADRFQRAVQDLRQLPAGGPDPAKWSLSHAVAWRDHLDSARLFCIECADSWRTHLLGVAPENREAAARVIEQIHGRIPVLCSSRLSDVPAQVETIDKCMILNGQLLSYAGDPDFLKNFSLALVLEEKKWAALLEALLTTRWLQSDYARRYLNTVSTRIYEREVAPDISGQDSLGLCHRAGVGGRVKRSDALHRAEMPDEMPEDIPQKVYERTYTDKSVAALRRAASEEPLLKEYVDAIIRYPKWKKPAIWRELGWPESMGKAIDRKYRRLRRRLRQSGAGMEWREVPSFPGSPCPTTYFEVLLDGARGNAFGVIQHKPLKTGEK